MMPFFLSALRLDPVLSLVYLFSTQQPVGPFKTGPILPLRLWRGAGDNLFEVSLSI